MTRRGERLSITHDLRSLDPAAEALARSGPAFRALELAGAVNWGRWAQAACWLERQLPDASRKAERIHWLTVPLLMWLSNVVRGSPHRAIVAGLSAPQGAGKSTLGGLLVTLLQQQGLRAVSVSIDDFYLRRAEQQALATAHPGDRLLEHRGYPGTHDLELGVRTLDALVEGGTVELPRYDKSAHGGRGDRSAMTERVTGPFDLVLLEGWMLGFRPVPNARPELATVNSLLGGYFTWHEKLDVLLALKAADPRFVLRWRVEAEQAARAAGKPALDDAAIEDYIRRFLPAYETWAASVSTGRWSPDRQLVMTLDGDRTPIP
ncbi:MAG TPA: hypothetical protein VGE76_01475 [Opitutaceae bacterium]